MLQWLLGMSMKNGKQLRTVCSPKRRRSALLGLERLEDRAVPAGLVAVSVSAGNLLLIGDGNPAGNQVRVVEQGAGQFEIQGENGTQVIRLFSGTPAGSLTVSGITGNVSAFFLGGDDAFTFSGIAATRLRDLNLSMGGGNDTVSATGMNIRNLAISQGNDAGNDQALIEQNINTPGGIRGFVAINNGGGADTVTLEVKVAGNVLVTSRDGGDTTSIQDNSQIGGALTVTNTTGPNGNLTIIQGDSSVGRNLAIVNGNGGSINQVLDGTIVGGNVAVINGNSLSSVNQNVIEDSTIGGSLTTIGTGGEDQTAIVDSQVSRSVFINSGAGPGVDTLIDSTIGGSYTNTKGPGDDDVTFTDSSITGNLTLILGAGNNQVDVDLLTVQGITSIVSGAGDDTVQIDSSTFSRAVTIVTNGGDDTVQIGTALAVPGTIFQGALTILVGPGIDLLELGTGVGITVVGRARFVGDGLDTLIEGPGNVYLSTKTVIGF